MGLVATPTTSERLFLEALRAVSLFLEEVGEGGGCLRVVAARARVVETIEEYRVHIEPALEEYADLLPDALVALMIAAPRPEDPA